MTFHLERSTWNNIIGSMVVVTALNELRRGYFTKSNQSAFVQRIKKTPYCRYLLFVCAVTAALIFMLDTPLLEMVQQIKNPFLTVVLHVGAWVGKGFNIWFVLLIGYAGLTCLRRHRWAQAVFSALLSVVSMASIGFVLKRVFMRARPHEELGPLSFLNFEALLHDKGSFHSFPSGDVAVSIGATAFLFFAVKNIYPRFLILCIPAATALSRMTLNKHWPSDVFFSLGLGLIIGSIIWQYHESLEL
jgi:membrane-associated phospholipid phosphatase